MFIRVQLIVTAVLFSSVASAQSPTPAPATARTARPAATAPAASPTPASEIQPVAEPAMPASPAAVSQPESDRRIRFNLGFGFNSASTAKFDDVKVSGAATGSGKYDIKIDEALFISAGAMIAPRNDWGVEGKLTIEAKRDLNSASGTLNGNPVNVTFTDKPSVQVTLLEANALYRWDSFYIPFGLNYSIISYKEPASSSPLKMDGAIGAQLGIGYFLNDNFHISAYSKAIGFSAKESDPTVPLTVDYGDGYLAGLTFQANYLF